MSSILTNLKIHPAAFKALRSRVYRMFFIVSGAVLAIPANQGLLARFWDMQIGSHHIAGITLPVGTAAVAALVAFVGAHRSGMKNTYLVNNDEPTSPTDKVDAKVGTSGVVEPGTIPPDLLGAS